MRLVITVDVIGEMGETINSVDVEQDLKLYLMDFAQTEKSSDVIGGFAVTRAVPMVVI